MHSFSHLSSAEIELLPNEDGIRSYENLGWYVSPIVLPGELLDAAAEGAQQFYAGVVDFDHPEIAGPANDSPDPNRVLMNNEFVSLQKKEIQAVVYHPLVAAIAARLARSPEIRLFADALMCKQPALPGESGVFGWHTDKGYWPSCTSNDMLTAWIPLQDVTPDMGPMIVIENSHRWKLDGELRHFCAAGNRDLDAFESFLKEKGYDYKMIPMTLKKGQLSFHNGNAFHASGINTSDRKRTTITIHFQDSKNSYSAAHKENGEKIVIGYERICRKDPNGDPDYRDPRIFPVLWSEEA